MRLSRALSNEFAAVRAVPPTYSGLVDALSGTKAAAQVLGISQREVQRQVAGDKASRGEAAAGQKRGHTEAQQSKLAEAVEAADWGKERAKYDGGMKVRIEGEALIEGSSKEHRDIEATITDKEQLDALFEALADHRAADAAAILNDALFDAYSDGALSGAFYDVETLDIAPA